MVNYIERPGVGRESDKFMLRLPDGMREKIKEMADYNSRSMNAEIVTVLRRALDEFDYHLYLEKDLATYGSLRGPQPGDTIDGEVVPEPSPPEGKVNFVNTREDVERVVKEITEDTAKRLRQEMLKLISPDEK